MNKLYYFAYGSNLHPVRLQKRVPSANLLGLTSVPGYRLHFHKRHHDDNSGKCNMFLTQQADDLVYGALYEMLASEKPLLDQCEGIGYRCETLQLEFQGNSLNSFVYIAENSHIDNKLRPHSWYQQIVLLGAEFHQLPEDYLKYIREVEVGDDPDLAQQHRNSQLIAEMRNYSEKNTNGV